MSNQAVNKAPSSKPSGMDRFLNFIERAGNKIPDPAILFFWALIITWAASALLSNVTFDLPNLERAKLLPLLTYLRVKL